jgi:hypothetical protein
MPRPNAAANGRRAIECCGFEHRECREDRQPSAIRGHAGGTVDARAGYMHNSSVGKPLIQLLAWLALSFAGCSTLRTRPPDVARRASLAVLCGDPAIYAHARWCGQPSQRRMP